MIPPWYTDWCKTYCALIGVNSGIYMAMLKALWPHFEKHSVEPGELNAATERFIHRPKEVAEPWGSHYGFLMEHVKEIRAAKRDGAERQRRLKEDTEWKNKRVSDKAVLLGAIGKMPEE